ncbi:MAG TPA: ATP synthase F1 subunit delta [Syntrophorhabdaceae bacterium]|nr:ATP synthase F1 subunit delta [Syntrophorhabdaceae bacterium]
MISQSIARKYAKGLFNVGEKNGKYKDYLEEFKTVLDTFDSQTRLKRALMLPLIEVGKRKELMSEVVRMLQMSAPVSALFLMLLENNRMSYLPLIKDVYSELVDEKEGRVKGSIWSAYPLDDTTRNRIEKELGAKMKKEVLLTSYEDKTLIGGIKVMIKGTIIDGSVKQQLASLKENILKE